MPAGALQAADGGGGGRVTKNRAKRHGGVGEQNIKRAELLLSRRPNWIWAASGVCRRIGCAAALLRRCSRPADDGTEFASPAADRGEPQLIARRRVARRSAAARSRNRQRGLVPGGGERAICRRAGICRDRTYAANPRSADPSSGGHRGSGERAQRSR